MVGWHHQPDGHEFEQTLGDGKGQASLACWSPWGRRESDTTERLNNKRRHSWHSLWEKGAWGCLSTCGFQVHVSRSWARLNENACLPLVAVESVAQLCPTLRDPGDCSPPGSSIHGILRARILEWVAMPFSRGSFQPRD